MRAMRNLLTIILILILIAISSCKKKITNELDLSGEWKFQLDSLDIGVSERWFLTKLQENVILPGSTDSNDKGDPISIKTKWTGQVVDSSFFTDDKYAKYRKPDNFKIPFWLQADKHYVGPAWYQKEVHITKGWSAKNIVLFLERCHWETRVWVDDKEVGMQNSLSTPHTYSLTSLLNPGKHMLTIRVDNRVKDIDPGMNSHSISDHTQSNWNGIVGAIKLQANPLIRIKDVKIFPNSSEKKVSILLLIENQTKVKSTIKLQIGAESFNSEINQIITGDNISQEVSVGITKLTATLKMGDHFLLWDEYNPNLYRLKVSLSSKAGEQVKSVDFGMRDFIVKGSRFQINDRPVFLRGTLESSIFPKTGYPSTSVEEWTRIFKICKTHGLNHVRFHSHCPPEAAFIAADQVGIYLQVECGSWANSGSSLGDGKPIDSWLFQEADKILEAYGNHPSFCMMAYGNEPAGENQGKYLGEFVSYLKEKDKRRVYTGGAGWPSIEENDFYNNAAPRIQGWGQGLESIINKKAPQTAYDFEKIINETSKPYVSHEIGQWCVYPNFKEIQKYDGVLKAKNFEIFQETLMENDLGHLADSLLLASGKLQTLCYKADIEAALRTPGFAGFQLLDLHDFPGQGSALVGVLDAFWEEKGYVSPEGFREFCNQTVPLVRMEKRVFKNSENLIAEIEVAHFGNKPLIAPLFKWEILDKEGNQVTSEIIYPEKIAIDNCQKIGKINFSLKGINTPKQLRLKVTVNEYSNGWDFWVYPENPINLNEEVYITNTLDAKAKLILNNGGKVLWSLKKGNLSPDFGGNIQVGFSSIFWNTAWTRGQAPHTLGILCNPKHKALQEFPTDYHSNWQWWDAMSHGQAIQLDKFSKPITPIVRIIDDWFENRNLGLVFEAKAGNGKIIVCGADLLTEKELRFEAQQLLYSLTTYMNSSSFNPISEVTLKELTDLVTMKK